MHQKKLPDVFLGVHLVMVVVLFTDHVLDGVEDEREKRKRKTVFLWGNDLRCVGGGARKKNKTFSIVV